MFLEKYFRNELDYLRELGKQLAAEKPHLANFLSDKSADPDVERLLEGFAFLTGTLRAKIDDEFPEFTHSMLNLLWPNYLRPVPSMTILEFTPDNKVVKVQDVIEKGMYVFSKPISTSYVDEQNNLINEGHIQCTFQTCRDVCINPFEIKNIISKNSDEKTVIDIHIESDSELVFESLDLNKIRFFLGADEYTNHQLYLWFSYYLESTKILINDITYSAKGAYFSPIGFNKEDSVLPYSEHSNIGYRVLQEYFCYQDSFLFLDAKGFEKLPANISNKKFCLRLSFSRPLPPDVTVRKSSLRLNCVPAINLFHHDSENIVLDGSKTEYLVRGSHQHPDWYEIFSIDKVTSFAQNQSQKRAKVNSSERIYESFESFRHQIEYHKGRTSLYYRVRTKNSLFNSGFDHYLSFVRGDEAILLNSEECVSVEMTCTNRELSTSLKLGDICIGMRNKPSATEFKNITRPSIPLHPILDGTLAWKLISNSSLNYLSLLEIDSLKEVLKTYDLPAWHSHRSAKISQKKLDAIKSIETHPIDRLFKGIPVRGLQSTLSINPSGFSSEGDLFLFGTVLANFFSIYASINSFHKLRIINTNTQEIFEWPIQLGQQTLI